MIGEWRVTYVFCEMTRTMHIVQKTSSFSENNNRRKILGHKDYLESFAVYIMRLQLKRPRENSEVIDISLLRHATVYSPTLTLSRTRQLIENIF